jgi:hypothetical protein
MKKILFSGLAIFIVQMLYAQAPDTAWTRTYGGSGSEFSSKVIENTDGDYFFASGSTSQPSEQRTAPRKGSRDIWVVKTTPDGTKVWDKAYGPGDVVLTDMAATADGGFIVGGNTPSGKSLDKTDTSRGGLDVWIIKVDRNGTKVWDKTLGGNDGDFLGEIIVTPDGSILVAMHTGSPISGDRTSVKYGSIDAWVVKLNSNGQYLWDKSFGGTGGDDFYTGLVDNEGNYLFGGSSNSPVSGNKTEPSRGGDADGWLVKTDANGNKIWDKTLGGDLVDYIQSMAITKEGEYVLGINSESGISGDKTIVKKGGNDCWLVKINKSGGIVWQKSYGGSTSDVVLSVKIDNAGDIYLGCRSVSDISGDKECPYGGGIANDSWILKTNNIGAILWQSCFSFTSLDDAKITSVNDYVISGTKAGMRLIKLKTSPTTGISSLFNSNAIEIYPNPASHFFNIQLKDLSINGLSELEIYSLDGKLVLNKQLSIENGINQVKFDLQNGVYFLHLLVDHKVYSQKFVVNK